MAQAGRDFVLSRHTYGHRLRTIVELVAPLRPVSHEETVIMKQKKKAPSVESPSQQPIDQDTILSLATESATGNMRYDELLALAKAVLSREWKAGEYICEIGTFHGMTASFLGRLAIAAGLPCPIVSVDSFESPYLVHLSEPSVEYYKTMANHGLAPVRNHVVRMRSTAAEPYLSAGIGLLLVDGGHDYDTCLADLRSYTAKLAPDGLLAIDDVWYESVRRATDHFCGEHPEYLKEVSLEKLEIYRRP
jgi:predicted O-methyltransferase YrrM